MSHHHAAADIAVSRRLRTRATAIFVAVLAPALAATVVGAVMLRPTGHRDEIVTSAPGQVYLDATVVAVDPTTTDPEEQVVIRVPDGSTAGLNVPPEYLGEIDVGARLEVVKLPGIPAGTTPYVFVDFERGPPLALLAVVFVVLVVAVARWRGLAALLGLGLSLAVIGLFTLPALLDGQPAVGVGLVSAAAIMFVVLYLAHGFTLRTSTALVGTLAGLIATAAIAAWASGAAHLTGLSGEYALDLMAYAPDVRIRDVLLCGMILAGLGVLNDVTITQASAVWELHATAPHASRRVLFARGMRIGRDHIASTVYTIVFAYLGATLPLVMLVAMSDRSFLSTLTNGELAEEVARTLVGSIGLVLAIPLTTLVAVAVVASGDHDQAATPVPAPDDETSPDPMGSNPPFDENDSHS